MNLDTAKELFSYDGKIVRWRIKPSKRVCVGDEAGCIDYAGYKIARYKGELFYIHRVAFGLSHGYLPHHVDHINGSKTDNGIENLRAATPSQNAMNSKLSSANKSGVKGVSWSKAKQKWVSQLSINGKQTFLGHSDTLEEAAAIVDAARSKHHGEFANGGLK